MRRRRRANLSRGMLFTWGMGFGLAFLLAVPQEAGSRMQLAYARVFRWPLAVGHGVTLAARPTTLPKNAPSEEFQELQTRIANLQAQLMDAQQSYDKLAGLRQKAGWEKIEIRQARIVLPADQSQDRLIINCGTDDGVANGQFVVSLSDAGDVDESVSVVGVVSNVTAKMAKIRSITDKDSTIYVGVANLSTPGTMEGQGNGTAKVVMMNEVRKGDPVYALKQEGLDVPVIAGRVTDCRRNRDNPIVWEITVEPVHDVAAISDVAVVVSAVQPQ